jgi:hypothetical protein
MKTPRVNCERFGAWLDAGQPPDGAGAAHAHAATCERCREALAADRALEEALESWAAPAPAGFTGRVMRAIERANEARTPATAASWKDAMPWWSRAALQPQVLGAAALAALVIWRPDAIEQSARVGLAAAVTSGQTFGTWFAQAMGPGAASLVANPAAQVGIAAAAGLMVTLLALPLYRWTEKIALRSV